MTTASKKNRCAICSKEKAILRCVGCSKDFCYTHVADHRQELGKQLDEVETTRDIFRQSINEQKSRPVNSNLMKQIDQWESSAISKVHQAAEDTRRLLLHHTTKHVVEVEGQLKELTEQLRRSRRDDDFFETDLARWKNELARLAATLQTSPSIYIRQDAGTLVNTVVIETQRDQPLVPVPCVAKPPEREVRINEPPQPSPRCPKRLSVVLQPAAPLTFDNSDDEKDRHNPSSIPPDIMEYRNHYPHARSNPKMMDNYNFYADKIPCTPDGDFIDNIHKKWFGDVKKLDSHSGYIEWLFPLQEKDLNGASEPLQKHEIEAIKKDKKAFKRILESYRMMLDFYGFELTDERTGEVRRLPEGISRQRFQNLNSSPHNHLRITRILKSLGEFDYEYLKFPFLEAILFEAIIANTLPNCLAPCQDSWIATLRSRPERRAIRQYAKELIDYRSRGITPSRAHRALKLAPVHSPTLRLKNIGTIKNKTVNFRGS